MKNYSELKDPRARFFIGHEEFGNHYLYMMDRIGKVRWHWLQYHFSFLPPRLTAQEITNCCIHIEKHLTGVSKKYLDQIVSYNGRNRNWDDYQSILQIDVHGLHTVDILFGGILLNQLEEVVLQLLDTKE